MSRVSRTAFSAAGAAVVAGLSMNPAAAMEPETAAPSAYLGAGGGFNILSDMDFAGGRNVNADNGWAAIGTLGYRWGNGLRTELEGGYRSNNATLRTPTPTFTSGKVKAASIMANALIDLNLGWNNIVPYFGGGVGVARPKFEFATGTNDTNFAYQGIAGLTFKVSETLDAFADYRYFATSGMKTTVSGFANGDEYRSQTVMAGLRWTFWSGAKAAAPMQTAAPAPVMAAPKDYTIYFEFDKANITDAADAVLDEIKSNTQAGQGYSVVGHTDTSGSVKYNEALSQRRAKNTSSGLTSRGVTVSSESGVGETEPAVPTADGVKEPLNRRSVIKVNQ